jgi:aerobic carbon-monoxide dehydrogenase large subunit
VSIGAPLPRLEDDRLLTGKGRFTDDEALERQVWCAFVRSPHAHARIVSIDRSAAHCIAVLTGADWIGDGLGAIDHVPNPLETLDVTRKAFESPLERPHWPLAVGEARHVGEPVAAVIADSAEQARDAAERIAVQYEPLPLERTVCFRHALGDAEAVRLAFESAAVAVRHEFVSQRIANCQLEPRAAVGAYEAGRYLLISGSQGVHRLQQALAAILKVATENVRVVSNDVGGAFGPRAYLHPEQAAVVWAARRLGRPVRWTSDRAEAFAADFQGRDSTARAALALDAQGRILGYRAEVEADIGAHTVSFVPMANFRNILTTVYRVPASHVEVRGVLTNSVPAVPFRGAGRPEAHHALERLLDMAARRLGVDRAEIRRRNIVRKEELPYRTASGLVFDSGDFLGYMERALQLADYEGFPRRKRAGRLRGIGFANYVESPSGAPRENVALRVTGEGVEIFAGTQSSGQGHETSFAQVVAAHLGVPIERIRLKTGDTDLVKAGGGTHSDRSMRIAGALLVRAADAIIAQGRGAAAEHLEARAGDLEFRDGEYRIAGTDRRVSLLQLAKKTALAAFQEFSGRMPAYPAGAAVCELEIDPHTGGVEIRRYCAVDDVGQAINPAIVEGQTHGGIAQGIGQALAEAVIFEPATRQLLNGSFMDYGLVRAADLPMLRCALAEDPTAGNSLRVKGGGEGGVVPATAAVINAVCDALDIDDVPMPATPARLWALLAAGHNARQREEPQ